MFGFAGFVGARLVGTPQISLCQFLETSYDML